VSPGQTAQRIFGSTTRLYLALQPGLVDDGERGAGDTGAPIRAGTWSDRIGPRARGEKGERDELHALA
jgi:hypothetical protein